MKIIADSGSTKTSWRIVDSRGKVENMETLGLNPYYLDEKQLRKEIREGFLSQYKDMPGVSLYFYGSGCASKEKSGLMFTVFKDLLPLAEVHIFDDMLAAARATSAGEKSIVCILGTGSNSCLFDGREVIQNVSSLGFILGDEGSGSYLGKKLLADFIRKQLPDELQQRLLKDYALTRDSILNGVYHTERPNRYLAQFARFIGENLDHPYMKNLALWCFTDFFKNNVALYPGHKEVGLNFVGSVAWHFSGLLKEAAMKFGLTVKNIINTPVDGLVNFHKNDGPFSNQTDPL